MTKRAAPRKRTAFSLNDHLGLEGTEAVLDLSDDSGACAGTLLREFPRLRLTAAGSSPSLSRVPLLLGPFPRCNALKADAAFLPFAAGTFDAVVSAGTFHELAEPKKVVSEMKRVLKENGKAAILDSCGDYLSRRIPDDWRARWRNGFRPSYPLRDVCEMLITAGFKVTAAEKTRAGGGTMRIGAVNPPEFPRPSFPSPYLRDYRFTKNFAAGHIPDWSLHLAPFRGKPGIRYLEIGTHEGGSFFWMLENILTAPDARATCVDIFHPVYEPAFLENLRLSGMSGKVDIRKGTSRSELKKLRAGTFDIIYIDASHFTEDVRADAALAWPLLKAGGVLIFDDYELPDLPPALGPKPAIDRFLETKAASLEVLRRAYQVTVRKTRASR